VQVPCHLPAGEPFRWTILFKIIQASRKILEAVDLFVALATVKLKSLISEDAVQLCGKRVGAGGRESRVSAAVLPIAEGLQGQLGLTALAIVLKMLLATYHRDDGLAVQVGSAKAKHK